MRILLVANVEPDPDAGASGTQVRLAHWLGKIGHEVDAIWAEHIPRRVKHPALHAVVDLPRALRAVIRAKQQANTYDIVCVNQPMGYLAAKDHVRRRRHGAFIRWTMGLEYGLERALAEWLPRWGLRKRGFPKSIPGAFLDWLAYRQEVLVAKYASGHVVLCENDREILVDVFGVPEERTANVHQAPLEEFQDRPVRPFSQERLNGILTVGQFVPYKGIYHIAETINRVLPCNPQSHFTWGGTGLAGEDAAFDLLNADARERTTVPGKLDSEAFMDMFDQHGIFLFPSITEGFGKAFLEAMARGLCVVATNVGGMRDVIVDGENGFLVEPGDVAGLEEKITKLWAEPGLAAKISEAAQRTAREYTWERVARDTADFFQRVLGAREAVCS